MRGIISAWIAARKSLSKWQVIGQLQMGDAFGRKRSDILIIIFLMCIIGMITNSLYFVNVWNLVGQ